MSPRNAPELLVTADRGPPAGTFSHLLKRPGMQTVRGGTRQELSEKQVLGPPIAMAQQAFAAGWEHQQVADLLIAHRRAHAYSPGTLDEYQRLLAVALQRRKRRAAHDMFEHKDLHDQLTREEFHGSLATILGC